MARLDGADCQPVTSLKTAHLSGGNVQVSWLRSCPLVFSSLQTYVISDLSDWSLAPNFLQG
jgi:hypothetical protein